jgi:intergrase/recombinase
MTKVQDPNEIFDWIIAVKQRIPSLTEFLDFIAVTGLRLSEAINSYNLIIDLSKKGQSEKYYVENTQTLEHFRFKKLFIRKSKKAFVSFVPKELIIRIEESEKVRSKASIQQSIVKKAHLKIRFSDIREAHASFMTKYLKPQEIDFLHGRIGTSVFMENYYNPSLVEDLKARTLQGINEIQEKVKR